MTYRCRMLQIIPTVPDNIQDSITDTDKNLKDSIFLCTHWVLSLPWHVVNNACAPTYVCIVYAANAFLHLTPCPWVKFQRTSMCKHAGYRSTVCALTDFRRCSYELRTLKQYVAEMRTKTIWGKEWQVRVHAQRSRVNCLCLHWQNDMNKIEFNLKLIRSNASNVCRIYVYECWVELWYNIRTIVIIYTVCSFDHTIDWKDAHMHAQKVAVIVLCWSVGLAVSERDNNIINTDSTVHAWEYNIVKVYNGMCKPVPYTYINWNHKIHYKCILYI